MVTGQTLAHELGAFICFEDEAGQSLKPPKARTWGRRGKTPIVRVRGKGSGRVSMTGLIATRPGLRTRLFYRIHVYRGRKGERKGLCETDYQRLLCSAHAQLRAPMIVVWDNINQHNTPTMRAFVAAHPWLTVVQLPTYAPDLNPTEGVWSHIKRDLGNLSTRSIDHLAATVKTLLKRIQYQPTLLDGFIAATGLVITTQTP